ncbi:MAG TPA: lysylphosphatidylglycerol synthase transmembrane domain-containing protein [Actinoplanes sp.]|nr:lysylphosphatidylglycerol synthase transmembrane domain-containing protein [Actinoplanes sp.]
MTVTTVPEPRAGGTAAPVGDALPPERSRRSRPRWRIVLGVAVVALLGAELVLAAPTLKGALTALPGAQPWWIAAAVLAEATSMDLFARMRRRLLAAAGVRVRMRDALAATYVADAVHLTVPGGAAFSTAYAYRWMRERGAGPAAITWTLVTGGLISTSALAALAVAGSLLVHAASGLPALVLDAVLVVALVVGARRLRRRPDLALLAGRRLLAWRNALLRRPPNQGGDALDRLVGQLRLVRPGARDVTAAAAYGVGNWVFDCACLAAAAAAVGTPGLSVSVLLIAYTAGMAASGLSLLPAGIGIVETAMVLAMVAGGIPAAAALPAVLLYRLISLVAVVAAGWLIVTVQTLRAGRRPAPGVTPPSMCAECQFRGSELVLSAHSTVDAGGPDPRVQ